MIDIMTSNKLDVSHLNESYLTEEVIPSSNSDALLEIILEYSYETFLWISLVTILSPLKMHLIFWSHQINLEPSGINKVGVQTVFNSPFSCHFQLSKMDNNWLVIPFFCVSYKLENSKGKSRIILRSSSMAIYLPNTVALKELNF